MLGETQHTHSALLRLFLELTHHYNVTNCKDFSKNSKVFQKNVVIQIVSKNVVEGV